MKHFIAMAGLRGCMPNYCDVYFSEKSAVESLCDIHDKGYRSVFANSLRKFHFAELNLAVDGNEYGEIVECDCDAPWEHSDDPDNVKRYLEIENENS